MRRKSMPFSMCPLLRHECVSISLLQIDFSRGPARLRVIRKFVERKVACRPGGLLLCGWMSC